MRLRSLPMLALAVALTVPACGGENEEPAGGPTGSTEEVTQTQADEAMDGVCNIATGAVTETEDVLESFHARAHEILHHVASEAKRIDPAVAGTLLEAKSVVETDLLDAPFPSDLPQHAQALAAALTGALETIGLQPAGCP